MFEIFCQFEFGTRFLLFLGLQVQAMKNVGHMKAESDQIRLVAKVFNHIQPAPGLLSVLAHLRKLCNLYYDNLILALILDIIK